MLSTTQSNKLTNHLLNIDKSFTFFTCSVHELLTRQIEIAPNDLKPEQIEKFYNPYKNAFEESNKLGRDWLSSTYPKLKTTISSTISETANMHKEISKLVNALLDPYELHEKIPEEVANEALEYIHALQNIVKEKRTAFSETYNSDTKSPGTLNIFSTDLTKSAVDMKNAASDSSVSSQNLSKDIQKLTNEIENEKAELVTVGNEIIAAGTAIPVSLTIGVISIALAPFTFGGTLAIGAATLVAEGASIGGFTYLVNKKTDLQNNIYNQTKQIKVDTLIVHFASDIRRNSSNISQHLTSMEEQFSNIITIFMEIEDKLNTIIEDFTTSGQYVKSPNLEALFSKLALQQWDELVEYAKRIELKDIKVKNI